MGEPRSVACRGPKGSADNDVAGLRDRRLPEMDAPAVELAAEAARHRHAAGRSLSVRWTKLLRPLARLARRLQRSAAKRTRRIRARSVTLDADFGLAGPAWEAFAAQRLTAGLARLEERSSRRSGDHLAGRRIWLVFVRTPDQRDAPELMPASLAGARRLQARASFGVACIVVGQELGSNPPQDAGDQVETVSDLAAALRRPGVDDLVALLRPGDVLKPEFAEAAAAWDLFDHDLVLMDGVMRQAPGATNRAWPVLHPGLNYLHGLNCDYFRSRAVLGCRAARAALASGARDVRSVVLVVMGRVHADHPAEDAEGANGRPGGGLHIGLPLLELVGSPDRLAEERAEMVREGRRHVFPAPVGATRPTGPVSVVICTKDRGLLLRQLIDRLLALPPDSLAEAIVVQNGTTNPYAICVHEQIARDPRVVLLEHEGEFNFSAQCARGAARATGKYILLLNDDIVPVTPGWLDCLLAPFADPAVAIAGPLLLYPDERVQQAGMFLGHRGTGGHTLRSARLPDGDYMFLATAPRYVSAVTGAAMLIERGFWEEAGGLDMSFAKTLQDVDICMRAAAAGRRVVYAPNAVLFHVESVSAKSTYADPATACARGRELAAFGQRLAAFGRDPFHNASFDMDDETMHRLVARPGADHGVHGAGKGFVR